MRPSPASLVLAPLLLASFVALAGEQLLAGAIEAVAELPINPGHLAVTESGRVFATVHPFRRAGAQLIEVTGPNSYQPWPNPALNGAFGSGSEVLNSALGIRIDDQGRLWVLDNGLGDTAHQPDQPPKILAFTLADGSLVFRYDFPTETAPAGSFLNDLAVDAERGFVYISDPGGRHEPALVTLDLKRRLSRRFSASPVLQAEDLDLVVAGRVLRGGGEAGKVNPARLAVNPISLSADGETLYFGAMRGKAWYQVPARLLREGADDATVAATIVKVGPKPLSDGAATDSAGNHYFTDMGHNAISILGPDGNLENLVVDDRLDWPDALDFGEPDWLYVAVNQLHRSPPLNGGIEAGKPPFRIMRVYTGSEGED